MRTLALAVLLTACADSPSPPVANVQPSPSGAIRVKVKRREGGAIELHGDRTTAMQQAEREMAENCGAGAYKIMEQGEEPVDVESTETAFTIHYICVGT